MKQAKENQDLVFSHGKRSFFSCKRTLTIALFEQEWHDPCVYKLYLNLTLFLVITFSFSLVSPLSLAYADSPKELAFGMSAAFTGANGEMGVDFYRGIMVYLDYLNANGGAGGWKIKIIPANDGYNPIPCFYNTLSFIEENHVFALFSYLGSPTTLKILPLLQKFHHRNTFLLFPLSGTLALRTEPYCKYIYTLRASYHDETAQLVDRLVSSGHKRLAVFFQNDAYGRTGWDGIRQALAKHDLTLCGEASYHRGANVHTDFVDEATILAQTDPDAVICVGTYASQAAFIRDLRDTGFSKPIAGLSFADSGKMLDLLVAEEKRNKTEYTTNLLLIQAVPSYEDTSLASVRLYRKLMDRLVPKSLNINSEKRKTKYSSSSFEGFLNARLLGEMIKRMADAPNPKRIPSILQGMKDFDLGIGTPINFTHRCHQGLDTVYFMTVRNGHIVPVKDWKKWQR